MQLTRFTDYALRVLIHLAIYEDQRIALPRIAEAFGVSQNHLVKTVQTLVGLGLVESQRGRGGGLRLGRPAAKISVGEVVRATEPGMNLLDCFDDESDACVIAPACRLKTVLKGATNNFLAELDAVTIADVAQPKRRLRQLLA